MRKALGQGWVYAEHYDKSVEERMLASGKAYMRDYDGMSVVPYHQNGWDELLKQGLLVKEPNMVEPIARERSFPAGGKDRRGWRHLSDLLGMWRQGRPDRGNG
ncbi:MAG: hypothetical protein IPK32_16790 [Verrucomicrobiaceae bacterium]|nr:hypothetical protein [Verrucomicrobiaceae bacterium]